MKKIVALLLATVMCLALVACGGNEPQTDNSGSQQETANNTIQGKTLVVVGEEYTTQKDNVFKVSKIDLTDESNATFHLYFTYENKSDEYIQDVISNFMCYANGKEIQISWRCDVTDILPNATDDIYINANNTWDKEFSFDKVEKTSKQNAIICFTIDGTDYYIEMKTFLNAYAKESSSIENATNDKESVGSSNSESQNETLIEKKRSLQGGF